MAGGVVLTVIRGDGSRLCHGDDVLVYRDRRGSMKESRSFLEVLWSCSGDRRGIGVAGYRGPWDKTMEPDCFAMPSPPRTSGFSCSRLSLHCSRACAAETRSAHPHSLLQDRRGRSHLLRAIPVLLSHHWPSTCSCVVYCLSCARACRNEPSRLPVLCHVTLTPLCLREN
jgi:hypothetical protein